MREQRVFVSYSRGAEDPAKQGLHDIIETLTQKNAFHRGFDPTKPRCILIDDAISPGEPWRERLYEWLELCDHAIIYCSPDVTNTTDKTLIFEKKSWLFYEAVVLAQRCYIGDLKCLIPVYAYVTMDAHPFARLEALHLRKYQSVFFTEGEDRQPQVDRIVARLCDVSGAGAPATSAMPAGTPA